MMNINVGAVENNGLGAKLRDAFIIVNDNFNELLSLVNLSATTIELNSAVSALQSAIDDINDIINDGTIPHTHFIADITGLQSVLNSFVTSTSFNANNAVVTDILVSLQNQINLIDIEYTAEDVSNKQNSLNVDGTGVKYPTVDAVNQGFNNLGLVATSNDYNDLDNIPLLVTSTSNLINDGQDGINPFITLNDVPSGYTNEQAQDAVGSILEDSSEIDFTYNDTTPSITASLRNNSITNARLEHIFSNHVKGRLSGNGVVQDISMLDFPISTATQTALDLKQNTLVNPLTGSLTSTRIPFSNSVNSLTDSDNLKFNNTSKVLNLIGNLNVNGINNIAGDTSSKSSSIFVVSGNAGSSVVTSGFAIGGNAGENRIEGGNGGDAITSTDSNIAGSGGDLYFIAGDGGQAFGGSGFNFPGNGGNASLQGGESYGGIPGFAAVKAGNNVSPLGMGGSVYIVPGFGDSLTDTDESLYNGTIFINVSPNMTSVRGNTVIGNLIDDRINRLQVTGKGKFSSSVQVGDNLDTATADNVGAIRYRSDANNSYMDMCMQTGTSSYAWVNIKTNTW